MNIAYFITPHGFGHAARAAAVMTATQRQMPDVHFDLFTLVPDWIFSDSLDEPVPGSAFTYHRTLSDVGMVQATSLSEDLSATLDRLDSFLPFDDARLDSLAETLKGRDCHLVLCDISPLGIAAARRAGLPSVLIENFTWDWIYDGYLDAAANARDRERLQTHMRTLQEHFAAATHHIQTTPAGAPDPAYVQVAPVGRASRTPAAQIRERLRVPADAKLVLLTMGGTHWDYTFLQRLADYSDTFFLIPGAADAPERHPNSLLLPPHSGWFHPDLIAASDAVVGKLGYSTLAEIYLAGGRFGYVLRPQFRESPVLDKFVQQQMVGIPIEGGAFASGHWLERLPELLALPLNPPPAQNGATQIARLLQKWLQT